jgi:hypothetical protein
LVSSSATQKQAMVSMAGVGRMATETDSVAGVALLAVRLASASSSAGA